jgi:uncharacterized repeat protein (TIGR04138 family)
MQEVSFEDALEIITLKDPRYPREAYLFVREALDHTQRCLAKEKHGNIRHVSGQELLGGIKDYASSQFGPMAMMVLQEWGIHSCQDFGQLVFNMVETGGCPTLSNDDILDFEAFLKLLRTHPDPVSSFLWQNLSGAARSRLDEASEKPATPDAREILIRELNGLILTLPMYREEIFSGVALTAEAKRLVGQTLNGVPRAQLNRLLLELAFPQFIAKSHGLLAKTKDDTRADFEDGYDFYEAFRKPFLPPSKQTLPQPDPAPSPR